MRVCHIVPSLEERHGGPSKSVRALANATARTGTPTSLLATFEPGQPMQPLGDDAADVKIFTRGKPLWLCRSTGLREHLQHQPCDVVHHHALWLRTLHYAKSGAERHGAPLVIAPRGMMSGWAYAHRRWRKRLAEWWIHPGAFARAAGWHATSAAEAEDIRQLGFTQPVCIAPNGVEIPVATELAQARAAWAQLCPAIGARPVALFYSRFHRKKRLRELIELWGARPRGDWFLLLVGVPEEYSVAEIQGWIDAAGLASHLAVFSGRDRPAPFAAANLFLLPSHSENFGLVIAEALAAGVPALVTDTTPWPELAVHEAGECVSWSDYPAALDRLLSLDSGGLARLGRNGQTWVRKDFTWESAARRLLEFYSTLPR